MACDKRPSTEHNAFIVAKQAKVINEDVDAPRTTPHDGPCAAAIDILTNDTLYHIFNGACVCGTPLLPPECRWVPALVCRRWRSVIECITSADLRIACLGLAGRIRDTVLSKGLYRVVTAYGMAMMARHGLAPASFGAWTLAQPTVAETAAILVASDRSDRIDAALRLASRASDRGGWSKLGDALKAALTDVGRRRHRPSGPTSPKRARRVLVWVAARHCTSETIRAVSNDCERKCAITAVEHAIRFDRAAAFGALLEIYAVAPSGERQTPCGLSSDGRVYNRDIDRVWLAIGRWGALSTAEMLLEIEKGNCVAIDDDLKYALSQKSRYDGNWSGNWVDVGAATNDRPECLDFCHHHGLEYEADVALGYAFHYGSVAFCQRFIELYPLYLSTLKSAVELMDSIDDERPLHPRTASWLMGIPELQRTDPRSLKKLWHQVLSCEDADMSVLLRTAASIIQQWPSAFHDILSSLPLCRIVHMHRNGDSLILDFLDTLPAEMATEARQRWESYALEPQPTVLL